ncbi:hypothetical protein AJ79_08079 [Helicocarpus griseus UAMH5409]|uniref:Tyrosinase copper-binding domain-containing protein n=1 Tax=Helicocarpus griseus UAMH5409 TaxID=1447875 RepID=A0A2B7WWK3_9EURO|nr:hypothetical protein AJ79_08079 [Helicocarpus griseus UAMH5409]
MRALTPLLLVGLSAVSPALAQSADPVDLLAEEALTIRAKYDESLPDNPERTCTEENVIVRKEWGSLSESERVEYTNAVLCLLEEPSQLDPVEVPGARNRYDDFVAVHINQTLGIHATGNFLTWHRLYVAAYEQALRNLCGYKGAQPYWAWNKYADDPINSPIFDGSPYSMSGNGAYIPHNDTIIQPPNITLPAGQGGDCVMSGPFKDMVVNLGPLVSPLQVPGSEPQEGNGLNHNPRCLRRDISEVAARDWTRTEDVMTLIQDNENVLLFQNMMQGDPRVGILGVHAGGHYTINGDPGADFFASPGDPAFFLHHAMIDRTYWIWQNLDPAKRLSEVMGTITVYNEPPSRNTTVDDVIELNNLADARRIGELLDTTAGPLCYIYK